MFLREETVTITRKLLCASLLCAAALAPSMVLHADSNVDENGFVRVNPENIQWKEVPGYNGVKFAVIDGDPSKEGIYVVRVKFPPGLMTRPHFHPEARYAVVLEGTWWTGTGDTFDPNTTVPLKPGSFMKHPAGAHHFDGAKEDGAVLQIIGYGPSGTTYLHPEEGHTGPSK
jgi:quercetin dioxygenase-like cupin family protein